jgi:hypothetical protein
MSTFSFRSHDDNKALAKSEPAGKYDDSIEGLQETPTFFAEYSDVRRAHGRRKLDGSGEHTRSIHSRTQMEPIFSTSLRIRAFTTSWPTELMRTCTPRRVISAISGIAISLIGSRCGTMFYFELVTERALRM